MIPEKQVKFGTDGWRGILADDFHHELRRMAHVNFNVTLPLMDVVLGTKEKAGS